jgi:hypothetical protein
LIAKRPTENPVDSNRVTPFPAEAEDEVAVRHPRFTEWRGMFIYEWHAQNRLLLSLAVLWLVAVWTLPWFANPGWLLAFGLLYALLAGSIFGGKDLVEGCEEFTLALPPNRNQRYLARLGMSIGGLLVFTLLDLLALGLDLSQAIARLYVDTGFLKPVEVFHPRLLYGIVVALPWAIFCLSFALAINATSRSLVLTSWFWSMVLSLMVLRAGLLLEMQSFGNWTGYVTCPALVLTGLVALALGYRYYRSKEITPSTNPLVMPAHWWLWSLLFLFGLSLSLVLIRSISTELTEVLRK